MIQYVTLLCMCCMFYSTLERDGKAPSGRESQPEAAAAVTGYWQRKWSWQSMSAPNQTKTGCSFDISPQPGKTAAHWDGQQTQGSADRVRVGWWVCYECLNHITVLIKHTKCCICKSLLDKVIYKIKRFPEEIISPWMCTVIMRSSQVFNLTLTLTITINGNISLDDS